VNSTHSPSGWPRGKRPTPNASAITGAAAHASPVRAAGVFPQKISNSERVLLTVLYQRKLCTLDVLADLLGDVSRSAVGNVVRETRPLLHQDGHLPVPAPTPYRTAAELLAATPPSPDTPTS
jgi:hypothetical protein